MDDVGYHAQYRTQRLDNGSECHSQSPNQGFNRRTEVDQDRLKSLQYQAEQRCRGLGERHKDFSQSLDGLLE